MIKVVKNLIPGRTESSKQEGWALLRTGKRSPWSSLKLPFTIGAHTDNDVFVNAPTMRQISKVAVAKDGFVVFVDAQTMSQTDGSELKALGIDILGVFNEDPNQVSFLRRAIQTLLVREAAAVRSLPGRYTKWIPKSQSVRVGLMVGVAVLTSIFGLSDPQTASTTNDLSNKRIPALINNVVDLRIKSEGVGTPYSNGFTLGFDGAEASSSKEYLLTIVASGLDVADEFSIEINGHLIGQTQASIQCSDATCTRDFPVSASLVETGPFELRFKHKDPQSSYFIKSLFLRGMEPASAEDREHVTQLINSAERYFDERHLLVQNIRSAMEAIEEADRMLSTKTGMDQIKARFNVSKSKISSAFKEISADYLFRLQKEMKLGHTKVALGLVNDMLKLYPDPTSNQHMTLVEQRRRLQESAK